MTSRAFITRVFLSLTWNPPQAFPAENSLQMAADVVTSKVKWTGQVKPGEPNITIVGTAQVRAYLLPSRGRNGAPIYDSVLTYMFVGDLRAAHCVESQL